MRFLPALPPLAAPSLPQAAAWMLAACLSLPSAWAQTTPTAPANPSPQAQQQSDSGMGASLLYNGLHAEMLAADGQLLGAAQLMRNVARHERDRPELYERAVQLALLAGQAHLGLQAVRDWRQQFPQSAAAARYALQLHLILNQRDAAVGAMRDFLRYTKASDLDAAMTVLPGYFALPRPAPAADGQSPTERAQIEMSTATALENVLKPYTDGSAHAATAWGVIANIRAQSGQGRAALQAASTALSLKPDNANAAWVLLQALREQKDLNLQEREQAQKNLANFVTQYPPSPMLRLRYAAYLIEAGLPQAALEQTRILTKTQATSARFWLMQGLIELDIAPQDGAADDSLQQAWRLIEQGEDDEQGQLRDEVLLALSRLAQLRGDNTAALHWLDQAEPPYTERVQRRRSGLLVKMGRWQEALRAAEQLPEQENFKARDKLMLEVDILNQAKQYPAAYARLSAFVEQNPKDDEARYQLAFLAERLQKWDESERLLRQVMAAQPRNALAYNALGYSLADRGLRLPEAKALIAQALELAPNNAMIEDSMGWVEYKLGNLAAARKHLVAAFAALPDAEIGTHLGEVLWQLDEQEEARKIWRQVHSQEPDNSTLQETLQRLKAKL